MCVRARWLLMWYGSLLAVSVCVCVGQVLHDHLKIKYSVLRAYFEKLDRHEGNLVAVLHAK